MADTLEADLDRVREEIDAIRRQLDEDLAGRQPMTDEERDRLHERVGDQPDAKLVWMLLVTQKTIEQSTHGRLANLAEHQTVIISEVLGRFAPVAFADALSRYAELAEDDDADTSEVDEALGRLLGREVDDA